MDKANMTTHPRKLTVDRAVAEFQMILLRALGPETPSGSMACETPEEAEARRFRCAETLLGLACPDPRRCADHQCHRVGLCRHFADLRARQQTPPSQRPTRRSAGAAALRHAIWVYMNCDRHV
jgi:hypothetical protein